MAKLCVRLTEVTADGRSNFVTYGLLNLTHHVSDEAPSHSIRVRTTMCASRHISPVTASPRSRIRVALSETWWPVVWPSPEAVTLQVTAGASRVELPVRPTREGETPPFAIYRERYANAGTTPAPYLDPLQDVQISGEPGQRTFTLIEGSLDPEGEVIPGAGTAYREAYRLRRSIREVTRTQRKWRRRPSIPTSVVIGKSPARAASAVPRRLISSARKRSRRGTARARFRVPGTRRLNDALSEPVRFTNDDRNTVTAELRLTSCAAGAVVGSRRRPTVIEGDSSAEHSVSARIVIIGGGIVGCSRLPRPSAVATTCCCSSASAHLWHDRQPQAWSASCARLRTSPGWLNTRPALRGLERETGQATGFRQVGSIAVAASEARFEELKRGASMARCFGLEVQTLSPGAAKERWPLLSTEGLVGAIFLPKDGQTNPVDTTQALARGARQAGVQIIEDAKVTAIRTVHGRVTGVATEQGEVRAHGATPQAAREGGWANVTVPLHAAEHFYIVTQPVLGLAPGLPPCVTPMLLLLQGRYGKLLRGGLSRRRSPGGWDSRELRL